MASAQTIPKTVFTGTAIAVMIRVSLNAWIVSGVDSASHAGGEPVLERAPEDHRERPDEDHREVDRARRSGGRACCTVVPRREVADRADRQQRDERDREQHDSHGRCAGGVAALDAAEDVDGRDLGLERDVAGDDHERPELAHRLRERERDAREDRRAGCSGRRRAGMSSRCDAPSECAACSTSGSSSCEHRLHRADDERQRHEHQRRARSPSA